MFNIIGISDFGEEIIDTADTRMEAIRLVTEYRMSFGNSWIIMYKRK